MPPVDDHQVHEMVKKSDARPPCHSERNGRIPHKPGYYAEDRYYQPDGRWSRIMTWIPHKMTTDCQQPGNGYPPDPTCANCKELKI